MYSASIRSELRGRTAHGAALLAALALLAVPEPSYAEPDRAAVETTPSGTRFVASVRFVTPGSCTTA